MLVTLLALHVSWCYEGIFETTKKKTENSQLRSMNWYKERCFVTY